MDFGADGGCDEDDDDDCGVDNEGLVVDDYVAEGLLSASRTVEKVEVKYATMATKVHGILVLLNFREIFCT